MAEAKILGHKMEEAKIRPSPVRTLNLDLVVVGVEAEKIPERDLRVTQKVHLHTGQNTKIILDRSKMKCMIKMILTIYNSMKWQIF